MKYKYRPECAVSQSWHPSVLFSEQFCLNTPSIKKAKNPPAQPFQVVALAKRQESLHNLQASSQALTTSSNKSTIIKVVWGGKGRKNLVRTLARLLCECWWHPQPQSHPCSCREPFTCSVFTETYFNLPRPLGSKATSGSCVTLVWYRADPFLSSSSATLQALCSWDESSIPHLILTPQILLIVQSVP